MPACLLRIGELGLIRKAGKPAPVGPEDRIFDHSLDIFQVMAPT